MTSNPIESHPRVTLCANLCETANPWSTGADLISLLNRTCQEARFPHCERIYVGSYFCENYFLGLPNSFHDAMRSTCAAFDLHATLVVPIAGQAFLERVRARLSDLIADYADVYDEVSVNDVATFVDLARRMPAAGPWLCLGRLFSKNARDARYRSELEATGTPRLSPEARSCLETARAARPSGAGEPSPTSAAPEKPNPRSTAIVELDPTNAIVDVSKLAEDIGGPMEIAMHLPFCYATTGRNCGPASVDEPESEKFRLGRGCSRHCLRMDQGYLTDEGVHYLKHGRAYYFENPGCRIAGAASWRAVYAARWNAS